MNGPRGTSRAGARQALATLLLAAGALPAVGQERCGAVSVGTHAMHRCVAGEGRPTIVLAAGAGLTGETWSPLLPGLAAMGRVVRFDRAGLGASEAGPAPRTPTRIAVELRALLRASHVPGPYVLVGHSTGGIHALRFAALYPTEVRAVVLLDAPPPGFEEHRLTLLTEDERLERQRILAQGLTGRPDVVRLEREGLALEAGLGFEGVPRAVPLVVVTANGQDFGSLGSPSAHRALWVELSRRWLDLSDAARLVVAEGSGHMVHHERADFVLDLVRGVVQAGAP